MAEISPQNVLDLRNLAINEIAGSPGVFFLVSLGILWFVCAKNNVPPIVTTLLSIIFCMVLASIYYAEFMIYAAIAAAFIIGFAVLRIISRT